jgi:hypothetical protein
MQVGILRYRIRNADGSDTVHNVGAANDTGLADVIFSHNVDSVTFGACLSPAPGGLIGLDIIFEAWRWEDTPAMAGGVKNEI